MKIRPLLVLTAIVSSILGAVVVYLILTVPNDLKADSLLRQAKKDISDGKSERAQESLLQIVQQYPRTNSAAAATVALVKIADQERTKLERDFASIRLENQRQSRMLSDLQSKVTTLATPPPPAPKPVTVEAPKPKPAAKKTAPAKKKTTRRRR